MTLPFMPDGFNSTGLGEDEFNGGGVLYDPTWPDYFDSFDGLPIVIMSTDKLASFEGCADLLIAPERDQITIRAESDTIMIRRGT